MSEAGDRRAEAALALVGSPFRLRGRDPATGLDCVGVIGWALRAAGNGEPLPAGYGLRTRRLDGWRDWAWRSGFGEVAGAAEVGDIAVFAVGSEQVHLAIDMGRGEFVHAHAGLRRVVRSSAASEWTLLGHWRPGGIAVLPSCGD